MTKEPDRILIVENDPVVSDLIGRQTLQAAGYHVSTIQDANTAIVQANEYAPDVILADISLPGLSGIDLLVALTAQEIFTPVILMGQKGLENEIIQSMRLGAADYLLLPASETEILNVVEETLKKVHEERERGHLLEELDRTTKELRQQLDEAAELLEIGKDFTSVTDSSLLPGKIVDRFCQLVRADIGWLLLREETSKAFLLAAKRNLPASMPAQINQPWDDGISLLVAASGESLAVDGKQLKRYKIASLGESALVLPLRISGKVSGLLVLMRSAIQPFNEKEQHRALIAIDFASIALANARLLRSIEERCRQQEQITAAALTKERIIHELLQKAKREMHNLLQIQDKAHKNIIENMSSKMSQYQRDQFDDLEGALTGSLRLTHAIVPPKTSRVMWHSRPINLNEGVRNTAARFEPFTRSNEISISCELPDQLVFIHVDEEWLSQVLDGLVSNAVKFCAPGGSVTVRIESEVENHAHIIVTDSGPAIEPEMLGKLFTGAHSTQILPQRLGGLGISLPLIKDIVTRMDGKIWAENKPGQGVQFHLVLPVQ